MHLNMLKAKIVGGRIDEGKPDAQGGLVLDAELLKASGIKEFEKVCVASLDTGAKVETHASQAPSGSGAIGLYGEASILIKKGERVVISAFASMDEGEARYWRPKIVEVDFANKIRQTAYASFN